MCEMSSSKSCVHVTKLVSLLRTRISDEGSTFSRDFMEAKLVYESNETADMLVFQTNRVGVDFFSYGKRFFFPINLHG